MKINEVLGSYVAQDVNTIQHAPTCYRLTLDDEYGPYPAEYCTCGAQWHHEEDQEQRVVKKQDLPAYPKGEYDLRKLTRNPDRRNTRMAPVYPDRPPRKP